MTTPAYPHYGINVGDAVDTPTDSQCVCGVYKDGGELTTILRATFTGDGYVTVKGDVYVGHDPVGDHKPGDWLGRETHWRPVLVNAWRARMQRANLCMDLTWKVMRSGWNKRHPEDIL